MVFNFFNFFIHFFIRQGQRSSYLDACHFYISLFTVQHGSKILFLHVHVYHHINDNILFDMILGNGPPTRDNKKASEIGGMIPFYRFR